MLDHTDVVLGRLFGGFHGDDKFGNGRLEYATENEIFVAERLHTEHSDMQFRCFHSGVSRVFLPQSSVVDSGLNARGRRRLPKNVAAKLARRASPL